jgi:hypothetical protein
MTGRQAPLPGLGAPPAPRMTVCPLCRTRAGLRRDGVTLKRHTFAARIPGGVVCGLSCVGGGLTVEEARHAAEAAEGVGGSPPSRGRGAAGSPPGEGGAGLP